LHSLRNVLLRMSGRACSMHNLLWGNPEVMRPLEQAIRKDHEYLQEVQ
jgi:hypothetical protein